jgi:hypothetical protein
MEKNSTSTFIIWAFIYKARRSRATVRQVKHWFVAPTALFW